MAVPKRRVSSARQGKRRSHHYIKERQMCYCNNCGSTVAGNHMLCSNCGWVNSQGRTLVDMERKEE
jgi:large subunit ribosomal protein L32